MTNLTRRIERLEKHLLARQHNLQRVMEFTLHWLDREILVLLLSAYGAEATGRPLTEPEISARRAYEKQFKIECRRDGIPYPVRLDHSLYLERAIIRVVAFGPAMLEKPDLTRSALAARQEGRTPTQEEAIALRDVDAEWKRCCELVSGRLLAEE